jgi:hypothetical protein
MFSKSTILSLSVARITRLTSSGLGLAIAAVVSFGASHAQAGVIEMGDASTFAVLGASTVTNTGPSTIYGNVGVAPGTAITGFPPGQVFNGSIHENNAFANSAQADALTAYNQLAGLSPTMDLTGQDLGGLVLTPGVYSFSSSAFLTGTLTLDGLGQTNPLFVFQMGTIYEQAFVKWRAGVKRVRPTIYSASPRWACHSFACGAGLIHSSEFPRNSWHPRGPAVVPHVRLYFAIS